MVIDGDRSRTERPQDGLRALTAVVRAAEEAPHGRARHDHLVSAFIRASELAAGVAEAEAGRVGLDHRSPAQDAAMGLLLTLARKLAASLGSGFVASGPPVAPALMALALAKLPETIRLRTAPAYAFDAVYPEVVLKAAAGHAWGASPLVIGLRPHGAGPAALVAAVTGAGTTITLGSWPGMRISDELATALSQHTGPYAIVDEAGDGVFEAAADLLQGLGVAAGRIVRLGAGSPVMRRATFERLIEDDPLAEWFVDLTGPVSHVEDLSAGSWRRAQGGDAAAWPPADPPRERRKFRLETAAGRLIARFAGLGETGQAKLRRAEALHQAGFTVEPLGLRHGFLLERWEQAGPMEIERGALIRRLGDYMAFRCAGFPAKAEAGADLASLKAMARASLSRLLDADAAARLSTRIDVLQPQGPCRPIHVDGRLHPWEWITTPDGLLLKTDALDHSEGPDLIGCQDVTWDIAGAAVEFDLEPEEVTAIVANIAAVVHAVDQARLDLMEIAYTAFQAGLWTRALESAPADERARVERHAARYVERLRRLAA